MPSLVGSEMCIRDRAKTVNRGAVTCGKKSQRVVGVDHLNEVAVVRDDVSAVYTYRGSGLRGQGAWVEERGGTWWVTGAFGSWRGKQLPEQLVQPSTGRPGVMFLASRQDAVYAVEPIFFFRMTCRLLPALLNRSVMYQYTAAVAPPRNDQINKIQTCL